MVKFGVSIPTGREGLMLPTGFASRETIVDAGRTAEKLGYYSVWGNDHITVQSYIQHIRPKPSFYEPLISMAAISSVTEKIKLATGIFVLPWRTPSIVICAKQLATLDVLSGGRLILGVGTGAYREESNTLNIKNNLKRMDEGVEALRILFEKPTSFYHGKYVNFENLEMYPKPLQKPFPIYLGRHLTTPQVFTWIAKHGQGWIPGLSPEQFAEAIPRLKEALREEGRRLDEIDIVREISVSQARTRNIAIKKYMDTPASAHMKSLSRGKRKLIGFEKELHRSLIGTANDIIKGVQNYLDVGVKHFMLNFAVTKPEDLTKAMREFEKEVMPSFC